MVRHFLIRESIPIQELSGQSVKSFGSKKKHSYFIMNDSVRLKLQVGGQLSVVLYIYGLEQLFSDVEFVNFYINISNNFIYTGYKF